MTERKQFKKLVIMGCHPGLTYGEATHKELGFGHFVDNSNFKKDGQSIFINEFDVKDDTQEDAITVYNSKTNKVRTINAWWHHIGNFHGYPITIGRVMQALNGIYEQWDYYTIDTCGNIQNRVMEGDNGWYQKFVCNWKLTKDGVECDDDDQSDETIRALLKLLK